jgi:type I restriction enzyme S subunit
LAKLEQLIAKKKAIKQGAMQELLKPKEGWEVKTILELADSKKELFDDGDWIESEHITNEGVRLIQTGNIGVGHYVEKENKKFIYEKSFEKLNCKALREGDLLICRLAEPAGRACIMPKLPYNKVVTSVDVTIFRPRKEVTNRNYLKQVFSTSEWFQKVMESVGGTTHKRISRGALGRIPLKLPSIQEQTRIATILSEMDEEIAELENKKAKVGELKQGMMQELLTGKTRLIVNG